MIVLDSLPWFSLDENQNVSQPGLLSGGSGVESTFRLIQVVAEFISFSCGCRTKAPIFFLAAGQKPFSLFLWFMVPSIFKAGNSSLNPSSASNQTSSSVGSPWLPLLFLRAHVMTWAHLNNSKQCYYFKGKQYLNYISVSRD